FRWHAFLFVLAFCASLALVVGTHRLFCAIKASDEELKLEYPWPRSNVRLNWSDITEAKVEVHQFRFRYMFRLSVKADSSTYLSPWAGKKEVQQAHDAIQAHLGKPQKSFPAN